jgi:para-aminobenzoate synthetase/4-amino-4-deoxychorismate lyase
MIVDLIRNDLGRISKVNSVKVSRLFEVEKYNTLFQMTSRVSGRLREDITYADIFRSIFPGGSVTGAPKIRTMQIIRELENKPRNIYCGALGIIFPKDKAIFNLPIRTISLIRNKGEMGVGGGIVIDSHPEAEYEECLLKGRFLTDRYKPFRLIETILWDGQYRFLDGHLKRMQDSADYFDFYFNPRDLISSLGNVRRNFDEGYKYKVRLLLDKQGNLKIDYSKMVQYALAEDKRIIISKHRIDPEGIFWYHKTTNRTLYDAEYNYYHSKGYFDVIFLNTRGEVTEGAISNIVIKKNNKYYTPAVSSGLLPGIFRQYLIDKHDAQEKILYLKDLINADKTFLCNSVRGLTEVKLK